MPMTPSTTDRSEWQTPVATIRTRTSSRRGGSSITSSTETGACFSRQTAAFMLPPRAQPGTVSEPRGLRLQAGGVQGVEDGQLGGRPGQLPAEEPAEGGQLALVEVAL